jgi:hypothetical protein
MQPDKSKYDVICNLIKPGTKWEDDGFPITKLECLVGSNGWKVDR